VGYRGYFDETEARALATQLRADGLEVSVYGVPAYSTLGWMNWAGGDPLLNTFIHYPEGELARMVFHELAHQVLYVKDDTRFNESFATAVERIGSARWMAQHASRQAQAEFAVIESRRAQFRALTRSTRRALEALYQEGEAAEAAAPGEAQRARKAQVMQDFRAQYAALKTAWAADSGGPSLAFGGYDAWVANANNASFGARASYDDLVAGFEALFARESQGATGALAWQRFYDSVKQLAELPRQQRLDALQ
jgi:predicted aminopeptidase